MGVTITSVERVSDLVTPGGSGTSGSRAGFRQGQDRWTVTAPGFEISTSKEVAAVRCMS